VRTEPIVPVAPNVSTCRVTSTCQLGVAIYGLHGELDSETAAEVRDMLSAIHEESEVVLDLRDVTTMDLEGVATLRGVIRSVHENGGRIAISRPWRLATVLLGLMDADGLVLVALSATGAVAWLDEHRR
jgi:anti-anti-sigma factor